MITCLNKSSNNSVISIGFKYCVNFDDNCPKINQQLDTNHLHDRREHALNLADLWELQGGEKEQVVPLLSNVTLVSVSANDTRGCCITLRGLGSAMPW